MPLPATPLRTDEDTYSDRAADYHGPWEYNGALYVCLRREDPVDFFTVPAMYKSTDDGDTWSVVDAQGDPSVTGEWDDQRGADYTGWSFHRYGDVIYVAWAYVISNGLTNRETGWRIGKFDLATETWTDKITEDTTSPVQTIADVFLYQPDLKGAYVLRFRSTDGACFLAYCDYQSTTSSYMNVVKLNQAVTPWEFETPVQVSRATTTHMFPVNAVASDTGLIHWFPGSYTQAEYQGSNDEAHLYHVALKTDDTFGTVTEIYDSLTEELQESVGLPVISGSTIAITGGGDPAIGISHGFFLWTADDEETPTFTRSDLPVPYDGSDLGNLIGGHGSWDHNWGSPIMLDGKWTVLLAINEDTTGSGDFQGALYQMTLDGASWSFTKLYDTDGKALNDWLIGSALAMPITGGYGVVFNVHGDAYQDTEDYYFSILTSETPIRYSFFSMRPSTGSIMGGSKFSLFG